MTIWLACATLFVQASTVSLGSDSKLAHWWLLPADEVSHAEAIMNADYDVTGWVKAIVPGTSFNSYVAAGHEKDPNFGDNIHQIARDKYDRSFWYRCEFDIPADFTQECVWLHFNGINRKGEIYLNGEFLGTLDGFMERGRYLINQSMTREGKNVLAVLVHMPQTPLANCGSPTYLSSGGWDWMPYVPGLNSGITDKVYLSNTGSVILQDPWVRTVELKTRAQADLSATVRVKNTTAQNQLIRVRGTIMPGNISFSKELWLDAGSERDVTFTKRDFPQLTIKAPRLWWPNGYGEPFLYTCHFEVENDKGVSEASDVTFGIRKYTYDKNDNIFHIHINGVPVFVKGGNWGMSEYMLRCRGEEYFTKVRLHKEMNYNMIRNWLGSVTDDEFYQACDKYGIMVWDDFWINSNPNLPYDLNVFNNNMMEKIKRVRNHACVAVWCGDNEATPQPPLTGWMAENIATFDGGDRHFQPCSNDGGLSGSGYWGAFEPRYYFLNYPDPSSGGDGQRGWGFRTEIGTASVPTFESFKKFMPEEHWWPRDEMWNLHYFGPNAFNAAPDRYDQMIAEGYGAPEGIEDYCRKAQLVNLVSNKAMYEGWLDHMWNDASGIMAWMGQSAYPSMVWQTYDYYYDLTGVYWGTRSACEPLHIMWNPATDAVKIANTTRFDAEELTAVVDVYNLDGKPVAAYHREAVVTSPSNSVVECFTIPFNKERVNLSLNCRAYASSTTHGNASDVTDGDSNTRWAALKADNEWITIDLGEVKSIGGVRLNWEASFGKSYKIQSSIDGETWSEVYKTNEGREGVENITFPEVDARYVRMLGIELGWWFGYSLWDFDVLSGTLPDRDLSDVHFIRLTLKDKAGKSVSENTYWRGNNRLDFTALNSLEPVDVKLSSKLKRVNGKAFIEANVSLPKSAKNLAFAICLKATRTTDGERLLPAIMSDNYFTLMPGESKQVTIEFDESLLQSGSYRLTATPYNINK